MSRQPPSVPESTYVTLEELLHPPDPQIQEISILPDAICPNAIQHDPTSAPPALAISKTVLLACFLRARDLFLSALHDEHSITSPSHRPHLNIGSPMNISSDGRREDVYNSDVFHATGVLLLLQPNYYTAVNWRKKRLLELAKVSSPAILALLLRHELAFLTSLLTSPLPPHHSKSSTLWSHRLWLLRTFPLTAQANRTNLRDTSHGQALAGDESIRRTAETTLTSWGNGELRIIMQAGERHPRNYYAWTYARDLWRMLFNPAKGTQDTMSTYLTDADQTLSITTTTSSQKENTSGNIQRDAVLEIHRWCLGHPRDISGWSFLIFLLQNPPETADMTGASARNVQHELHNLKSEVRTATEHFVDNVRWEGQSIQWFLKSL